MIQIGCTARFNYLYENELEFAKNNDFKIMQIWYDKDGIRGYNSKEKRLEKIKKYGFPAIIHALLDINEIEENTAKLIEILSELNHHELIIHPVCHSEDITIETIHKLSDIINKCIKAFKIHNITVFLENNSRLDPIFADPKEIEIIFKSNPELEFVLDIAHINSYEHLRELITMKKPKILHIADKHFNIIHEHLPIGAGELDFKYIFEEYLSNFEGTIIFEIIQSEDDIVNAKKLIEKCIDKMN